METRTVLLIDGDSDSRAIFSTILAHHDLRTVTARDADEGFATACEIHPELIVVDPFMRQVAGERLLARLRDDERTSRIPVLVLTTVPFHAEDLGVRPAEVLSKPCPPGRLVDAVRTRLPPGAVTG
jgi:two-component system response regulator RpaA